MRSQDGWALAPTGTGTTGVGRDRPATRRRLVGRIAGTAITAILASTLMPGVPAYAVDAPLPAFPNNITIFPNRDFVVVDFPDNGGDLAMITVTRAGLEIGRAEGNLDEFGFLEVNHPGGVCWGTGAGAANITPNILAGDVVTVAFGADAHSAVTQSPTVTGFSQVGKVVTVDGTLSAIGGPAADTANLEQRIVAPDLKTTLVGRRDVRAGGSKPDVFTSTITFPPTTPPTFIATYTFEELAVATAAAAGQARALTWQATDADANRQGITISEFGEVGGPGFGGCPLGTPVAATAPTTPVAVTATAGNFSALVTWREQASGGAPLTRSLVKVFNAANVQVGALRPALAGDTTLLVTGLSNQPYRFQVAAENSAGLQSGFSLPSSAVTPRSTPGATVLRPSNPGAVGGAITARANWLPPASNGGSAINGYVVTALRLSATGRIMSRTVSPVQHSSVRGLTMTLLPGSYRFMVQARNGLGLGTSGLTTIVLAR